MAKVKIEENGNIVFRCPACEHLHVLDKRWDFNGDINSPTFKPSILVRTGIYVPDNDWKKHVAVEDWQTYQETSVQCHSYVTNGLIKFEPDSSHSMKGETIELQNLWE